MWTPTHQIMNQMSTEEVAQYSLLPPPPPPPYSKFQSAPRNVQMTPQYTSANVPHQSSHPRPQGGGKGRGKGRGAAVGIQNQGARMPSGLVGPWQQNVSPSSAQPQQQNVTASVPTPQPKVVRKKPEFDTIPKTSSGAIDTAAVKRKLLEGLVNVKDESHPKELLEMFSPLKCDLCVAKMNSTMQSKMHYSGKQHLKKVKMFMASWSQANGGEPSPKRAKTSVIETPAPVVVPTPPPVATTFPMKVESKPAAKKSPDKNISLYCQCCDLSFTSALHAEQHYMGRNHSRVLTGQAPLKTGYFNPTTGKWQRRAISDSRVDPSGRFGIGIDFMAETPPELMKGRFYCDLCSVGATSQEQLDMHLNGSKHKKMQSGNGKPKQPQETQPPVIKSTPVVPVQQPQVFSVPSVSPVKEQNGNKNTLSAKNLALFRTPSGKFYCQPCNLTLNSESQFTSHTESKKHKLKQASQKPAMVLTGPKAAQWGDKAISS